MIKSWNNLGSEFHNIVSLSTFINQLTKLIRPNVKSIFKLHDALGIKLLYQLRVGLSPLKCHKKNHNFVDTPDDWCDCLSAPEDTQHFLLKCTLFSIQRAKLKFSVSNSTCSLILTHITLVTITNYTYMDIIHLLMTQTRILFYPQFCILKILVDLAKACLFIFLNT